MRCFWTGLAVLVGASCLCVGENLLRAEGDRAKADDRLLLEPSGQRAEDFVPVEDGRARASDSLPAEQGRPQAGDLLLVEDGRAKAELVIAERPPRMVRMAAHEFRATIEKISGARLPAGCGQCLLSDQAASKSVSRSAAVSTGNSAKSP